ncbi:MAG: hypothetical protein H0T79_24410 [Deltaproteobacteria bacterium]|nr:hypothetical protein [Deltaproteobacteria bacterium]
MVELEAPRLCEYFAQRSGVRFAELGTAGGGHGRRARTQEPRKVVTAPATVALRSTSMWAWTSSHAWRTVVTSVAADILTSAPTIGSATLSATTDAMTHTLSLLAA